MNTKGRMNLTFYGPREVCSKLNIGDSTLRKWAIYLGKFGGYTFIFDQHGHRSYSDRDITVLKRMQELLSQKYTYENAVKEICNAKNSNHVENGEKSYETTVLPITHVQSVPNVLDVTLYKELIHTFQEQAELNKKLVERLERLEERDEERNKSITQVLRQVLETRAELAASHNKKKNWWPWNR